MGILLIVGLIVVIIVLLNKNDELSKEINKLKNSDPNTIKYCPNCGVDLTDNTVNTVVTKKEEQPVVNNEVEKDKVVVKTKPKNDTSIKNSFILIAGALLIIISAITLLTTTWNYSHDIFKTIIISFMFVVFLGSSYIARDKLQLNVIGKVFLYIAMAYLPLIFLSISLFSLFGDYLSIYGEGNYIYLAISSILLSIIYYIGMKRNKDVFISLYGNIFHLLSVIFLSLIFSNNIYIIMFALTVYTFVYTLFNINNISYYSLKIDKILLIIYTISFLVISVFLSMFISINIFYILSLILDIILFYFLLSLKTSNIINPLLILFISLNLPSLFNKSMDLYIIFMLLGSMIIFILDYVNNRRARLLNYIYITVSICSLYLIALFSINSLSLGMFLLGYLLVSILYNIYSDNGKELSSIIIPLVILLIITHIGYYLDITVLFMTIIFSIIFIFSCLINIKDKFLKYSLNIASVVFMSIYYLIQIFSYLNNITFILSICLFGVLFIMFALTKKSWYKIISYIYLNIAFTYMISNFDINIDTAYGIFISLLIIFVIELINKFKNKTGTIFLFIQFIFSFLLIFGFDNNIVLLLATVLLYELYLYINKKDIKFNYLPLSTIGLFCLLNYDSIYSSVLSVIVFGILLLLSNKEKSIPPMTYLFSLFFLLTDFNKYLKLIVLIIVFGYYLYIFKKDVFKLILYVLITILLRVICVDINIGDITLFSYGLYVLLFVLCSVDVFRKHISWYKVLEYLSLILLYLLAMGNYFDELDGLIFVCLILILTIFGYVKKYGPIFIVSLIFILINMFYLTRVFWLSIPWWIYLLVVGIILILFAIYNEMNEKKNKNVLKEIVNKFNL